MFTKICTSILLLGLCITTSAYAAEVVGSDGSLTAYKNGTIIDSNSGLMWADASSLEEMNWTGALLYCDSFSAGGYLDWRMPTTEELKTIFQPDKPKHKGLHVSSLFSINDFMLCSSEHKICRAKCFNLISGSVIKMKGNRAGAASVLPVRKIEGK